MIRTGQEWSGLVRRVWTGYDRLGHDRSCQDSSRQARPDQDRSEQVRTGKKPSKHLK